jgi:hypothetical protein
MLFWALCWAVVVLQTPNEAEHFFGQRRTATECSASNSIAAEPVMPAATNLEIAIKPLQANAATTTRTELPPAIVLFLFAAPPTGLKVTRKQA